MAAQASDDPPRIRVAALMSMDAKIVLVRHRKENSTYHLLPGGGVEHGETLSEALVREITEETGLVAVIGRPLLVNDTIAPDGTRHVVNITFDAKIIGGSILQEPNDDRVEAVELVDPGQMKDLDMRPPIADQLIQALEDPAFIARYLGSLYVEEAM